MKQYVEPSPNTHKLILPTLTEQFGILRDRITPLKFTVWSPHLEPVVPPDSGGLLLLPKPNFWIQRYGTEYGKTHGAALSHAAQHLRPSRGRWVESYCESPEVWYRLDAQTNRAWDRLTREDAGDTCIIQVECGAYHAGKSPELMNVSLRPSEFPLDPYAMFMAMFMAHEAKQPTMDADSVHFFTCPGAVYDPDGDEKWSDVPTWFVARNEWNLDWNWGRRARRLLVNASGFISS